MLNLCFVVVFAASLDFTESSRLGGAAVISANKLMAEVVYTVLINDRRDQFWNTLQLNEEEMYQIEESFKEYDVDGNGFISKFEYENLVKSRTNEKKDTLEDKFRESVEEDGSKEAFELCDELRKTHLQQLSESQNKMLQMFEACDVNGDGKIAHTEFQLMEAWWLKCALNPSQAPLF